MRSREEVAAFINNLLHGEGDTVAIPDKSLRNRDPGDGTKGPHHYGICEFRHLMDFLYGGPPASKSEEILTWANSDRCKQLFGNQDNGYV